MFTNFRRLATIATLIPFVIACEKQLTPTEKNTNATRVELLKKKPGTSLTANVRVFAEGLNNPRGLEFGPDGYLYVAEAGVGGLMSTIGQCQQVAFPVGPYMGSVTGAGVSKISPSGMRTVVTNQLPTSNANEIIGGDVQGVSDVAFVGNTLYALEAGAGCSHGVASVPNGIFRMNSDGSWTMIADLSAFYKANPVANPAESDFEPDGVPYSMVNVRGDFYVVEPNHGALDKVTTSGEIERVVDISATEGHIVPTTIAYHGNFFVGNLGLFPIQEGSSKIMKITPSGEIKDWVTGLTTVLGLVMDGNTMYVLEMTVGAPFPTPGLGRILRIDPNGTKTVIASGLNLPTAMTMGPDGNLYVSNWGFSPMAIGGGQVLQVDLP
ncbi:MAG: ScyD/ScyE family protein [Bacteroidota bacterium]